MGKCVAIIGCLDTKAPEMKYMEALILKAGLRVLVIDASARDHDIPLPKGSVSRQEIAREGGASWEDIKSFPKQKVLDVLSEGLQRTVLTLFKEGRIDGVISAGGLQNTFMARSAMSRLPLGLPKVTVCSTMAANEIDEATSPLNDIVTVASIADIGGGLNGITKRILANGVGAIVGMVNYAGSLLSNDGRPLVGVTNLGVINTGATRAAALLKESGYASCMFHGTMYGGAFLEKLIEDGTVTALMSLCVHDILTEAIGHHQLSKEPILLAPARKGVPTLVSLSGMDVVDMFIGDYTPEKVSDYEHRKVFAHNEFCMHVKATKEEILKGGALLAQRLNAFDSDVTVVIPHGGFRANTRPGEPLYDPAVDGALIEYLHDALKPAVRIVDVDANANDEVFCQTTAREMIALLKKNGQ